MNFSNYQLTR